MLCGKYATIVGKKHLSTEKEAVALKNISFLKFALATALKVSIMRLMPTGWCESSKPGEFEIS
ncbi:MAG TPA: hypothetical protein DF774_14715 [Rheinheimera sp.]|nr:hypothetical protein [Rheinheimera sp.]